MACMTSARLGLAPARQGLRGCHGRHSSAAAAVSAARLNSRRRELLICSASEGEPVTAAAEAPAPSAPTPVEETVFYEGSGAQAELILSILLGATLVYLPLTMASIGRRLWVKYKFTNKRLIIVTSSPVFQREVQVEYSNIKEIRTAPRAFGLWGDMVIFLKDGSRLELVGLERCLEIKDYILGQIDS